ncbi:hypothetical protein ACFV4K_01425 [Nocardia sp. NPDC059764]
MTTTPPDPGTAPSVDIGAVVSQVLKFLGAGSTASYNPKGPKLKNHSAK